MTATKQDIGNGCRGRDATIRGILLDVCRRGDAFELRVASAASGSRIAVLMRNPPGADMSLLRKGAPVTLTAKLRDFSRLQDDIMFNDGSCVDCGG